MSYLSIFESYLKNLPANSITEFFFSLLIIIFLLSLVKITPIRKIKRINNFLEYTPTLLTSLGILGTFTGIVSGLLNFNIDSIDSSISQLLNGMKTAFITSVLGIGLSIILKIIYTMLIEKQNKNNLDMDSIIQNFYQQTEQLEKINKNSEYIVTSIGGNNETSLTGQIKLLRNDISDNYKANKEIFSEILNSFNRIYILNQEQKTDFKNFSEELWIQLKTFSEMLSKSATEAVIDALKNVIQDFNNKLSEQFGENFKELNSAVKMLVEWQENYKSQLNEMITLYTLGVKSLSNAESSMIEIEKSTKEIPLTMNNLSQIISINQQQINNLEDHLETFSLLRDRAIEAIPEIQEQISLILHNISQGNNDLVEGFKNSGRYLQNIISESAKNLADKYTESGEIFTKHLQDSTNEFKINTANTNTLLLDSNKEISKGSLEIKTNLERSAELITEQNKEINNYFKQLSEQIIQFANKWNQEFDDNVKRIQESFTKNIESMFTKQLEENKRLMSRLENESENALTRTGESINKQIKALDDALEIELTRVISNMGQALTSISHKFTTDYIELINAMHKITEQSKGRY